MNVHTQVRGSQLGDPHQGFANALSARFGHRLLDKIDTSLRDGQIELALPDGTYRILGRGEGVARLTVSSWRAFARLAWAGSEGWYLAWDKGEWDSHDIVALFEIFSRNRVSLGTSARSSGLARVAQRVGHWLHRNTRSGSRRNILAHYDLGNDFYAAWLDKTMTYSSALFRDPMNGEEALENAQKRKVQAIGRRLELEPASTILEIGCGWGYFSRLCAEKGHTVTAITLSDAQKRHAEGAAAHLARPPVFRLTDYRDVTGQYDAIASIEMVEAVGEKYWPAFLDTIARSLKPGGRAAIQYIVMAEDAFAAYSSGVDFIQKHVFPGGMLLSEARFKALAEARGLHWIEPRHFGLHYAETLRRWRVRFDAAVEEGRLPAGFDARFVRLWRYYLMYCEGGFRGGGLTVGQVTLVKPAP